MARRALSTAEIKAKTPSPVLVRTSQLLSTKPIKRLWLFMTSSCGLS